MKKKLKLKPFVLPMIYLVLIAVASTLVLMNATLKGKVTDEDLTYVSSIILGNEIPVVSTDVKMIYPYTNENVKIGKYYYDYKADSDKQEQSIVHYENTYMQNSGMDFILDDVFDVVSVLDGTVIDVKEDELLGKIVEIQHDNDLISIYQSLSEVTVQKDDVVKQGQIIGKTGENKLDSEMKNHLHFELYNKGQVVNPEDYFEKTVGE